MYTHVKHMSNLYTALPNVYAYVILNIIADRFAGKAGAPMKCSITILFRVLHSFVSTTLSKASLRLRKKTNAEADQVYSCE